MVQCIAVVHQHPGHCCNIGPGLRILHSLKHTALTCPGDTGKLRLLAQRTVNSVEIRLLRDSRATAG
jgi:hypothetical protein